MPTSMIIADITSNGQEKLSDKAIREVQRQNSLSKRLDRNRQGWYGKGLLLTILHSSRSFFARHHARPKAQCAVCDSSGEIEFDGIKGANLYALVAVEAA